MRTLHSVVGGRLCEGEIGEQDRDGRGKLADAAHKDAGRLTQPRIGTVTHSPLANKSGLTGLRCVFSLLNQSKDIC